MFGCCVGINGGEDVEQLGREGRRRKQVLVAYSRNAVLRHLRWPGQPGSSLIPFLFPLFCA
jgi:hypothetical protein